VGLRRFSPAGAPLSTVRLDRFAPTAHGAGTALAFGALGRPFAVWGRPQPSVPDRATLFAQLFDPAGAPLLPRFQVTPRDGWLWNPALGTDRRGNAVLVYENRRTAETSTLFLRLYDRNGRPRSPDVRLASPFALQYNPVLAVHASGRFVVAWQEDLNIWARVFEPPDRPLGPAFRVIEGQPDGQPDSFAADFPQVAVDREGRFVVAWAVRADGQPRFYARAFAPRGTPLGESVRVDRDRDLYDVFGLEFRPAVAAGNGGTFLIAWKAEEEGTGYSQVMSRLFAVR
jgi:hypothetical protein